MGVEAHPGRALVDVALAEALGAAGGGSGRLVLLLGEAGIGKTTTARDVATSARRRGVAVRWSACWSGGATVAHAPWLTLLSGLGPPGRDAMDRLIRSEPGDVAAATAAAAARTSAYGAVVDALEQATTERAALLVLDDLHWADPGTLQLLDFVASHLPGLAVLVVGTYRDTDVVPGSPLTLLGGSADRLALHGLDHAGVAVVLGEHLGAEKGEELATEVIAMTGGNPFLVVQIGRLLAEDVGALGRGALPAGARDLLQQRLGTLGRDDRSLVVAAGVLDSPFRTTDLAQVLGQEPGQVTAALSRAAALRIVERAPGTGSWVFAHDLFRRAALDGRESSEIAELHRRAAAVLEQGDAEAAVIATHLLAAGAGEAGAWSVRAGDRAVAAMAWEEAAGHYERALASLASGEDDVRADALAGLGRARLLAGDLDGARSAFANLAALARSLGSSDLLARAALGFSADLSGFEVRLFDQRQIDLLEEAAAALATEPAPGLRATVLARLSVALSLSAPDARRLELAEAAVGLAREAGEAIVLARALAAHCDAISGPAHVGRREDEASEIIAIAEAEGDGPLELLGRRLRYVARLERGDIAGVEADAAAYARRAESIGNPLYSWYVPLWQAQQAVVAGDVEGAERLIAEAEVLGRAAGSVNGPMLATVLRLAAFFQRGDYAAAVNIVESLDVAGPDIAVYISAIGGYALAYTLAGRTVEATALLDRAAALGVRAQVVDAEWLPNMTNLVRAAAALNHPVLPDALSLLEPYASLVAFEGIGAGLYGSVARVVALGCSALGRHDDAVRYAVQALAVNRGFGGTLAADAQRTLADCMTARGDSAAEAEALHADADAAYAAVGARHLIRCSREVPPAPTPPLAGNELRRVGDVWHVAYGGTATIVKHSKGLADLAVLLARPGQEVHVTGLEGIPAAMLAGAGGDALDRRAIAAYKDRLAELAEELDDADAAHDIGRAELARAEYDVLVDQLTGAVGISGRARAAGPEPVERLRKAVSARLRDAIRRIEAVHPPLGRHLANAVRTGTYCSYQPEVSTIWRCQATSGGDRS